MVAWLLLVAAPALLVIPALTDLFPWQQPGCKFGRTWPVAPDPAGASTSPTDCATGAIVARPEGADPSAGLPASIALTWAHGDYFSTFGIPLIRGRNFAPEEQLQNRLVVIVSKNDPRIHAWSWQ